MTLPEGILSELDYLLRRLRDQPPPSERHRQEQALSFAYGNLACSSNHKPSREAFRKLARERYGWSDNEFDLFANGRMWRPETPSGLVPWPSDKPARYNACTDPCDMWTGPCACGAWHKDGV